MIRLPGVRDKAGGPQLGATAPGPFGTWPDEDGGQDDRYGYA
ncbi:hypothetical protein [Streptomyces regalis]|nr:hypothetical protein [Streptomyces regalis]